MKKLLVLATLALLSRATAAAPSAPTSSPFPAQVETRVPFEPTAFRSGDRTFLAYEIYLTNFSGKRLGLRAVEVFDADVATAIPLARFEGNQIDSLISPSASQPSASDSGSGELAPYGTVVVFMWLSFDGRSAHVPNTLRHRVFTADSSVDGAVIGTHRVELRVVGAPVTGKNWQADDGPSNDSGNHHRRGIFVVAGRPLISRRYAIDWQQVDSGSTFAGDPHDKQAYHAYGKEVVAVADAKVIRARNDLPDNVPGHNDEFHPAVPMAVDTVSGNEVTIDLGGGQFAYYFHLQPGSVRVKPGDHVRRGQVLGRIGCSGDAREPHLHFEITNSPEAMAGDGIPYLIERYRVRTTDNAAEQRTHEMPLSGMVIDFEQS